MAVFPDGLPLTTQGNRLNNKIVTQALALVIEGIAIGDGNASAVSQNTNKLTHELFRITSVSKRTMGDNVCILEIDLTPLISGIATNWIFREVGIFARDPVDGIILYAYGNCGATADTIPPIDSATHIRRLIRIPIEVANAANVTFNFSTTSEAANIGADSVGAGVFKSKDVSLQQLLFRRLVAGPGIQITQEADTIVISQR